MKVYFFVAFIGMLSTSLLADNNPISVFLYGDEEVPGPGDPDGFGRITLVLKPRDEQICYLLEVENIEEATAAHIHRGEFGVAGPVVVTLDPPADGSSGGCISAPRELIRSIKKYPKSYYVNVHNAEFPDGALRGQLECEKSDDE